MPSRDQDYDFLWWPMSRPLCPSLPPAPQLTVPPAVDLLDLERRVADIEERLRREDRALAAKDRLRELGLVFKT